jgi:dTDP-4-dehydrorhamnose 3,5-epimerase
MGVLTPPQSKIEGVVVQPLQEIEDPRGAVLHMLRRDSPLFTRFGEVYFSQTFPGVIKAWKRHRLMTQHLAVPVGRIRLVIYDDRSGSPSQAQLDSFMLGRPGKYYLVRIPPGVWYGFKALSEEPALVANCTDLPHDPGEVDNLPVHSDKIPYRWE